MLAYKFSRAKATWTITAIEVITSSKMCISKLVLNRNVARIDAEALGDTMREEL